MSKAIPLGFISLALAALLFGALMGILAGIQYLEPAFLKEFLPFNRLRDIHVSSMVSWIVLCATGGIYYYISGGSGIQLYSTKLAGLHLAVFAATGLGIYYSLFSGNMGGREYLSFAPILIVPVLLGWVLFAVNYFKTLASRLRNWPVYLWMWGTGIVFMTFHLSEAYFWIFDYFRKDYIRDLTVQWKAYGSFTGSWNLLVYGTAIYLMSKIKKDEQLARSGLAFFFYFLGLANLMFGWAHHIYPVPSKAWIRGLAYVTSMTEWIVLGYMLTQWLRTLGSEQKAANSFAFRLLRITDFWIFVNVLIAVLISIPAINHYTHGSHITVAHSMGSTIGINTSILLASIMYLLTSLQESSVRRSGRFVSAGMILFNISLLVFLVSLILAGIQRGQWMYSADFDNFALLRKELTPYLQVFLISGIGIFTGLALMVVPLAPALARGIKG